MPVRRSTFSSFTVPNFRLYFFGHFISMTGTWMQSVALSWLIWRLTHSGDWLGLIGFSSQFLTFVLCLFGGVMADRMNRRNVLLIIQVVAMFQAGLLAALTYTNTITPMWILMISLLFGAIYAFDFPVRYSFVTDIVGKTNIDNAVALSSSAVHAARVIGPAIAGIIVAKSGEGLCFAVNAASFLALIAALLVMKKKQLHAQPISTTPVFAAIKEGILVAWRQENLKWPLILLIVISFFCMPYFVLIPMFVDKIYNAGPETFGFLMAASAAGAVVGSLFMASAAEISRLRANMRYASLGFSVTLAIFAQMTTFFGGAIMMFLSGACALTAIASINAWIQKEAPDHIRGRIMSLFTMFFFGIAPFGSLVIGAVAQRFGAPETLTIAGAISAFLCMIIARMIY